VKNSAKASAAGCPLTIWPKLCGLEASEGPETITKWEAGDGPRGPVVALLSILAYASLDRCIPREFSDDIRWIDGRQLEVGVEVVASVVRRAMRVEIIRRLS
jgi:hypothetical protein